MIRISVLAVALAVVLVLSAPVQAASPNYILVSGPGLSRPVVLANWEENGVLLLAVANARIAAKTLTRGLAHRRRFDLAEFWGWQGRPRPTGPGEASQHGWFYPGHGSQPPLIDLVINGRKVPRRVPARVLTILHRHGVPTHM